MSDSPSYAEAYRLWTGGDAAAAERVCQAILAAAPEDGRALHLLGAIARRRGERESALAYLERACAAENVPALRLDDLAELYLAAGRLGEAEAAARRALAAPDVGATAWHRLGLVLLHAGRFDESRDALERAVGQQPAAVDARNNLGIVLQRLGELDAALAAYRGALALDAENIAAHTNLASVLGELGQFEAALDHARRAIAREPRQVGAHVYAALAEAGLERHDAALQWLDRALALAPGSVPVLTARAETLRKLDRPEEGLEACRQALALAPENGEAWNTLALVSHALGHDVEAIAAFDAAVLHLPRPGPALANKATVLLELGHGAEGAAALEAALAAEPHLAAAWYTRADAKSFAPGDPDIAAMERLLEATPRDGVRRSTRDRENDRLLLHYALAKAYLDTRDGPRAFHHLSEGSRRKRQQLRHDAEATARWLGGFAEAFPPALFAALGGAGEPSETPIFVVGMPRSGTTLVQQVLAALPGVHAAGEPRHVETLVSELGPSYPAALKEVPRERFAALGQRYLALASAGAPAGTRRIIDKMPNNFLHTGFIHLMLPEARIVHCRRDAVDTCLSCYSKLFTHGQEFSYDLEELGRFYRGYEALMAHWRQVLPPERFIEIDYEAVVGDLEGEARRLVQFCGLAWDPACLRFHATGRAVRTASVNQVRRPLYASSVGRWKAFRAELAPLLRALGRE
ncbi:MAG TPA: sulfotransferase [Stellaceae bacterium]|nr:sulfotransferase [Stellaceae bacterium]